MTDKPYDLDPNATGPKAVLGDVVRDAEAAMFAIDRLERRTKGMKAEILDGGVSEVFTRTYQEAADVEWACAKLHASIRAARLLGYTDAATRDAVRAFLPDHWKN